MLFWPWFKTDIETSKLLNSTYDLLVFYLYLNSFDDPNHQKL